MSTDWDVCSVCDGEYAVTKRGNIRVHRSKVRSGNCLGSAKRPKGPPVDLMAKLRSSIAAARGANANSRAAQTPGETP